MATGKRTSSGLTLVAARRSRWCLARLAASVSAATRRFRVMWRRNERARAHLVAAPYAEPKTRRGLRSAPVSDDRGGHDGHPEGVDAAQHPAADEHDREAAV